MYSHWQGTVNKSWFYVVSGSLYMVFFFFFFNDTATTEIYTLSLHDALPISAQRASVRRRPRVGRRGAERARGAHVGARQCRAPTFSAGSPARDTPRPLTHRSARRRSRSRGRG